VAENKMAEAGRLPHACLISAQTDERAMEKALELAAAAVCTGQGKKPCGLCRGCRKVSQGIHPDVQVVRRLADDKGKLKKEILIEQIRALSADVWILPNEAERKVYIISEAEKMNTAAQNAALKLLEEPPLGAIFLLCTTNTARFLPTVRSRCTELSCSGGSAGADEELLALAEAYFKAVASGDRARLLRWCAENEGMDGRRAAAFLECALEGLADIVSGRKKDPGLGGRELELSRLLHRCLSGTKVNMGVKHIFGLLAVDSIAGDGNRG